MIKPAKAQSGAAIRNRMALPRTIERKERNLFIDFIFTPAYCKNRNIKGPANLERCSSGAGTIAVKGNAACRLASPEYDALNSLRKTAKLKKQVWP
jgi:hypothetical protein